MITIFRTGALNAASNAARCPGDPESNKINREVVERNIDAYTEHVLRKLTEAGLDAEIDATNDQTTLSTICSTRRESHELYASGVPTFWEWYQ
jgi:hypothetical protein